MKKSWIHIYEIKSRKENKTLFDYKLIDANGKELYGTKQGFENLQGLKRNLNAVAKFFGVKTAFDVPVKWFYSRNDKTPYVKSTLTIGKK